PTTPATSDPWARTSALRNTAVGCRGSATMAGMSSTSVIDDSRARHTRLLRGAAAGAFATFVALFSHVAGGGQAPTPLGVGVPLLLAVFVCVVLAGRKLSLVRLSASVGVSQTAFHWIFDAAASSTPSTG